MSIYRSQAGRRVLKTCYDDAIDQFEIEIEEQWIESRYGSTHVLLAGPADGQSVVVFHGGNTTNPMVLDWYIELANDYRLIAPDIVGQPGKSTETRLAPNGDEYGEWVVDLLDAFDIPSAPMIATSYGCGIVLRTAALDPDRIDRAALVVPAAFGTGSLVSMVLRVGLPSLLYRIFPREWLLERVLTEMVTRSDPDPVIRDTIAASLRYVRLEREFPSADETELADFAAPVALFASEDDPFFPSDAIVPQAREHLPTLTHVEILTNEKHVLSPAAQRQVTQSIREFFRDE